MRQMYTISTIHFQSRASDDLRSALMASADRAGVPWHLAVKVACRLMLDTCRAAATAQLTVMAGWSPAQWTEQGEVRARARQEA